QRLFFKWQLWRKGREVATKVRFFYRAPYHHHLQALWQYTQTREVTSVWTEWLAKLCIYPPSTKDQLLRSEDVNSRVIWRMHVISIWLVVLALVVYFKVR